MKEVYMISLAFLPHLPHHCLLPHLHPTMPLIWSDTRTFAQNVGIKVGVHGGSGSGKTFAIKSAPAPVIASAEGGTLSIASSAIPLCSIATLNDLIEFYNWCMGSTEARRFQTACIDSGTEIAERILGVEKIAKKDPRQAYGAMADLVADQIRKFRDIPHMNVYFTFKSALQEITDGVKMWTPMMPGKQTAASLPYYFDEFFYLGVAETPSPTPGQPNITYRYLQTAKTLQIEAKDRSGALEAIERPDLGYIFDKIRARVGTAVPIMAAPAPPPPPPPMMAPPPPPPGK